MSLIQEKADHLVEVLTEYYELSDEASNEQVGITLISLLCEIRLLVSLMYDVDFEDVFEKSDNAVHAITRRNENGTETQEG